MAGRIAAVDGDVQATAGATLLSPATDGAWSAGEVVHTVYDELTAGGIAVVHRAECTFTFTGEQKQGSSTTPVSGTETVTLEAGETPLQGGLSRVLLDGDSAEGDHGNRLDVVASTTRLRS